MDSRQAQEFIKEDLERLKKIKQEGECKIPFVAVEAEKLINKPDHYHKGGIDVLGYLEQHFPTEGTYTVAEGFYIGNIIKYVSRYKYKNKFRDLEKATDYLNLLCDIEQAKPDRLPGETNIGILLSNAYESDDVFTKNALLLEALELLGGPEK